MNKRVDELEKHYGPIERCDTWASLFFYLAALISVVLPICDETFSFLPDGSLEISFVVFVILYLVLSQYASVFMLPEAERLRRRQLLSDAFSIPITPEKTALYYNNDVAPSLLRLGANIMENAFFGRRICEKMLARKRMIVLTYFLIWLIAILNRSSDLGLLVALTQLIFSGEIILKWIKLEILCYRNKYVYEGLYQLFLSRNTAGSSPEQVANILDQFAYYESAKSSAAIKLSSKVFHRLNRDLSSEWEAIKTQLRLSGS